MNVFFKIVLFISVFVIMPGRSGGAQTPVDTASSAVSADVADPTEKTLPVDPNKPAPPSPIQLRIPHSQRTRANVLDSMIDFLLTQYFKLFENAAISYDYFEIDKAFDLNFTNFTVKITRSDIQGTVVISKAKVNFDEFLAFIKGKKLLISKLELTKPSVDMTLIENEKKRSLKYSAEKMMLNNISLFLVLKKGQKEDINIGSVSAEKAALVLSNPAEKYSVSAAQMKDVLLLDKNFNQFSFSSVDVDGKTYTDRSAFLQAIRQ